MPDGQISPALYSASQNRGTSRGKAGGLAVVLVLGLSTAGIFLWSGVWQGARSSDASSGAPESTLPLEPFVVNLAGSSQRAYLRVGITLGLAHPLPRNRAEVATMALVRDTILSILATAQPDELLKLEGKRQLKDELLKALQERVPQLGVENVYFTEFLVQM